MPVTSGQEGGCQCGAIRYRLLRAPAALYACHCRDCQKQSSSAFGLSMWVERDAVEFTGAEPRIYRTCGDSGKEKVCAFCGECGTRLYHAGGSFHSKDVAESGSDYWPSSSARYPSESSGQKGLCAISQTCPSGSAK